MRLRKHWRKPQRRWPSLPTRPPSVDRVHLACSTTSQARSQVRGDASHRQHHLVIVGCSLRALLGFLSRVLRVPTRPPASFEDLAVQRALGVRLKQLRHEREWTQEALVERCGLDRSFIAEIETGKANPTLRTLGRLARAFQTDLAELFKVPD